MLLRAHGLDALRVELEVNSGLVLTKCGLLWRERKRGVNM